MELFMLVSFTGMLVLLATHVVDFVVATRRPVGAMGVGRNDETPDDATLLEEVVEEYDRAA